MTTPGAGIRVTPQQLSGVAAQLTAGAADVDATLAQLANAVAPLGSDWAGMAQGRFQALWAQWQRDARGLHQALTGVSQLMSKASVGYDETEQAIASSFNV
jgi:WXG100 family type VII secretion target